VSYAAQDEDVPQRLALIPHRGPPGITATWRGLVRGAANPAIESSGASMNSGRASITEPEKRKRGPVRLRAVSARC
jgi:hypothetical protein